MRRTISELEIDLSRNRETVMDLRTYKKECRHLRAKVGIFPSRMHASSYLFSAICAFVSCSIFSLCV